MFMYLRRTLQYTDGIITVFKQTNELYVQYLHTLFKMDKSEFCTFIEMFHSKKANIAAERTDIGS